MKKVNEAFERLRDVMPDLSLILQDEKDTKVSARARLFFCGFLATKISRILVFLVLIHRKVKYNFWCPTRGTRENELR